MEATLRAQDLQIGNWVKHCNGTPMQVMRIVINQFACGIPYCWDYNNKYEPIPITPELLEKNGFRKTDAGVLIGIDDKVIMDKYADHLDGTIWEVVIYSTKKHVSTISELTYLHELQNLLNICKISKEIVV